MPKGLLFWMVFILVVILCVFFNWDSGAGRVNWRPFGGFAVILLLIFLLGWAVFGFVVQ
jgi:hypothetical protein